MDNKIFKFKVLFTSMNGVSVKLDKTVYVVAEDMLEALPVLNKKYAGDEIKIVESCEIDGIVLEKQTYVINGKQNL